MKESTKLDDKRSDIFHHIVAKLLYMSKRVRVDISTTIAFLYTRVSKSIEQDWGKLRRLLEYLNSTKNWSEQFHTMVTMVEENTGGSRICHG